MEETPVFEPYKMPEKINIRFDSGIDALKALYHGLAAGYWYVKRDRANEKMRKHGTWIENETEVSKFKDDLDGK